MRGKSYCKQICVTRLDADFNGVFSDSLGNHSVRGVLPGETVDVIPYHGYDRKTEYELHKIKLPSPDRREPQCLYCHECGGCSFMYAKRGFQLSAKTERIKKQLSKFKGATVHNCIGLSESAYRNKVHIAFERNNGELKAGFFNPDSHRVSDIPDCPAHGDFYKKTVDVLKKWIIGCGIEIYDPKTRRGNLRFAVVRCIDNRIMLTLVTYTSAGLPYEQLYGNLREEFDSVSLWQNINPMKNSVVFTDSFRHLCGDEMLSGEILGVKFGLLPDAFFQTNTEIAVRAYSDICKIIGKSDSHTVIDAYCGIAITGILFSKSGKKVISVEINENAVRCARHLAEVNLADNIEIYCGDFADVCGRISGDGALFFVDPPRRGLGMAVCNLITDFAPSEIVYLSCNADTLAQDLKYITKKGYTVKEITPYDFFPNTAHTEVLVYVVRNSDGEKTNTEKH